MNPEDFPLVEFDGRRLLVVPELPVPDKDDTVCDMCAARNDHTKCDGQLGFNRLVKKYCGDTDTIFLPEENFREYVIEFVRRRIS